MLDGYEVEDSSECLRRVCRDGVAIDVLHLGADDVLLLRPLVGGENESKDRPAGQTRKQDDEDQNFPERGHLLLLLLEVVYDGFDLAHVERAVPVKIIPPAELFDWVQITLVVGVEGGSGYRVPARQRLGCETAAWNMDPSGQVQVFKSLAGCAGQPGTERRASVTHE